LRINSAVTRDMVNKEKEGFDGDGEEKQRKSVEA
jgi:hypothetical protein